jgi:hypothetical protein
MTITYYLHTYNCHTSNFNFGEIFFLKFLSIQPLLGREWLQSGANRSKGTSLCSNFDHLLELSDDEDGVMGIDGKDIT